MSKKMFKKTGDRVNKEVEIKVTPAMVRLKKELNKEDVVNRYVKDVCKRANISRSTYYRLMGNEKVRNYILDGEFVSQDMYTEEIRSTDVLYEDNGRGGLYLYNGVATRKLYNDEVNKRKGEEFITEKCKRLGISRSSYYRKLEDKKFIGVIEEVKKEKKKRAVKNMTRVQTRIYKELKSGEEVENITKLCKKADVSRSSYYRSIKDKDFEWLIKGNIG